MIQFILFAFFIIFLFNALAGAAKAPKGAIPTQHVIDVPKVCPPHKWQYHEIKDQEGNTVKWKLACDICGPLKPMGDPARLE
jgi:hypothetical protein